MPPCCKSRVTSCCRLLRTPVEKRRTLGRTGSGGVASFSGVFGVLIDVSPALSVFATWAAGFFSRVLACLGFGLIGSGLVWVVSLPEFFVAGVIGCEPGPLLAGFATSCSGCTVFGAMMLGGMGKPIKARR